MARRSGRNEGLEGLGFGKALFSRSVRSRPLDLQLRLNHIPCQENMTCVYNGRMISSRKWLRQNSYSGVCSSVDVK